MQSPILVIFLVGLCFLVGASESEFEQEPTAQSVFLQSGTGLYPRQDTFPPAGRPGGLIGWMGRMGSQLSRLPQLFRPRPPRTRQPGRGQQPGRYQPEVVLPDPPGAGQPQDFQQEDDDEDTFDDDSQEPNEIDIGAHTNFNQLQQQFPGPQFFPQQQAQGGRPLPSDQHYQQFPQQQPPPHFMPPPQVEVVKSQMISYNHHQQPFNLPPSNSNAFAPTQLPTNAPVFQNEIPHSPPVKPYNLKNSPVPVVPQSTGPDYFDTAYRLPSSSSHGSQQSHWHVSGLKNSPENNYGATFQDIRQGSVNMQGLNAQSYPTVSQPTSQQGTGSLFSSIVENTHDLLLNSASSPFPGAAAAGPQLQQQNYRQHQSQQQQPSKQEPSVQILSQGLKDGNPVFEVLADADAPLFDGQHPFDINKLIAMIEPGAVVDQPPQLSMASSETQDVFQAPPSSFSFGRSR